jgi:hypothetical protein
MHRTAHQNQTTLFFSDNRFRMNGHNNNPSVYEINMSDESNDNNKRTVIQDDFYLASPLGWIFEILVRLSMGAILLASYIAAPQFIRHVERNKSLLFVK